MTKTTRQGTGWTKEDIRTLKTLFRRQSTASVAVVLDRTPKSVERKASKLGLTKTKKYMKTLGR